MIEPLAVATIGALISLAAFWLDAPLRWGVLALGVVLFIAGLVWSISVARGMGRTADAWRRR